MQEKSKSKFYIIIITLSILIISLGGYILHNKLLLNKDNNETNKTTNKPDIKNKLNEEIINLTKKNETITLKKNIELNFIGTETDEQRYKYNLEIKIDNKIINNNLFTKDELYIWQSDYAAYFKVLEFNELYFFISFIAKQNDGNWILITDKSGNIVDEIYDVSIEFNKENKSIIISDCNSYDIDAICEKNEYIIENNKLNIK